MSSLREGSTLRDLCSHLSLVLSLVLQVHVPATLHEHPLSSSRSTVECLYAYRESMKRIDELEKVALGFGPRADSSEYVFPGSCGLRDQG